jgi:NAD dependent epimerase/dehydratase
MTLDGRVVAVTGAGGFIGSHLVEALVARGARVRALLRYNSRADTGLLRLLPADVRDHVDATFGDLRNPEAVTGIVRGAEVVLHLGALIAIPYSYLHPREVVETNVLGTLNVLEAVRAAGARRLVHISTSEVYGTARQVPITEEHPLQGQSPYSASKIGADKIVESYHRSFGVPAVTVRPFNTYGPRQSARAVIPTIITQALAGGPVRLGSLHPTRDFTFVTDTARGMILAAEADGVEGMEINLGNDAEISVKDLAERIITMTGGASTLETDGVRLRPTGSEVERLRADNTRAREHLGWQPEVSLDDGLQRTIDWVRDHLDLYRVGRYEV